MNIISKNNNLGGVWHKVRQAEEISHYYFVEVSSGIYYVKKVFVSHVPPINNPYSPFKANTCYMVDVPYINADNWIYGHDHMQRQFVKAGVKFHTNAIGYPQHYDYYPRRNEIPNQLVDTYKTFELKTFII